MLSPSPVFWLPRRKRMSLAHHRGPRVGFRARYGLSNPGQFLLPVISSKKSNWIGEMVDPIALNVRLRF